MTNESSQNPPEKNHPETAKETEPGRRASIPWRRRLLYLGFIYLFLVLILVGIEFVVRLSLPELPPLKVYLRDLYPHLDNERRDRPIFEGDALLGWRLRPNLENAWWDYTLFSTNEWGLRHPRPIQRKDEGLTRIVCLGDSVTFGYRVPVSWPNAPLRVDPEAQPYPSLLEQRLRELNPDRSIEVVAMAVPGYSSHQGLAWLRHDIDRYDPDLVIACFGWNDTDLRTRPDHETLPMHPMARGARRLVAWSQTFAWLVSQVTQARTENGAPGSSSQVPRVAAEQFVRNMMAMGRIARDHGSEILFIGPIYRDGESTPAQARRMSACRDGLREAAAVEGFDYTQIDLLTEAYYPQNQQYFGEVIHPNHLGHRLMADHLLEFLNQSGLARGVSVKAASE